MEVPPVLRDQRSSRDESGRGDECIGGLRRIVMELKTVEQVLRQIDDHICLDNVGEAIDEREPLGAQIVVQGTGEFSADCVGDGEVTRADIGLE